VLHIYIYIYIYIYDISRLRVKKNCAPSWFYLQDYTGMHGQQNIKYLRHFAATNVVLLSRFESCSHEETVRVTTLSPGWWTTTLY